jgi:uncharacterized membrane protein
VGVNPVEVQVLSAALLPVIGLLVSLIKTYIYGIFKYVAFAPVAQLDRAFDYGSRG